MDFDWHPSYIFYGLGSLLGIAAAVYFGKEIILSLSPTVKSVLLLLGFLLFLAGANYTTTSNSRRALYVFSVTSYLVFLVFTVTKFSFSTNQTFLSLAFSSLLFLLMGYIFRKKGLKINKGQTKLIFSSIGVIFLLLVILDVTGPRPSYQLSLRDEVNISSGGQKVKVGTLGVENDFIFSRNLDLPHYGACVYTPERREVGLLVGGRYGSYGKIIGGHEVLELDLQLNPPRIVGIGEEKTEDPFKDLGTVPVDMAESCPQTSDTKKVVVTKQEPFD